MRMLVSFLTIATSIYIVLTFVGIGGTLFCYLFYLSGYVPRILAGWGIITYLSMLFLAVVGLVFPDHPKTLEILFYGSGTLFELVFGAWLLAKGVKIS